VGQHAGMVGEHQQEWWVNMVRNLHSENFVVDMGKNVGTEGGKKSSGAALNKVQISVVNGTSNVIIAFPTK